MPTTKGSTLAGRPAVRTLPAVPRPNGKGPRHMGERSPEERREIGRRGGLAAQAAGKHGKRWTMEEARAAGRKGGRAKRRPRHGGGTG